MAINLKPNTSKSTQTDSISIMTWNVGLFNINNYKSHPQYKDSMIAKIKKENVDVVCLQELVAADSVQPFVINMVDSIAKLIHMPYFSFEYNPKFDFDDRHHYGNCIFSKYPITEQQKIEFDSLIYNNSFQWVNIKKGKHLLKVINFHLQSLRLNKSDYDFTTNGKAENSKVIIQHSKNIFTKIIGSYAKRALQAEAIQTYAESEKGKPILVCGDMNDVPSSYSYFVIKQNMHDAFLGGGFGLGKTFDSFIPTLRIDHIFYSDNFICNKTIVRKLSYSDHYPVISKFYY